MRKFSYDNLIRKHEKRVSFIVLVSFLFTFIFVRAYVIFANSGIFDDPYIYVRGYHIHHLNYGIFIMAIVGFLSLTFQNEKNRLKIGALYGIGMGLTFDEFGMWMRLEDDYWVRASYDAIIVISLLFMSFVYFPSFWYFLKDCFVKKNKK
ncbi:MAG: hypothetical protein PHI66_02420 [Candidatus Pacebacteria bacterium]|nr:hypothetical protein [Candidatus Paceibacterota bacterium]